MTDLETLRATMDEIERGNKAQQEIILLAIESLACIAAGNRALTAHIEARETLRTIKDKMDEYRKTGEKV